MKKGICPKLEALENNTSVAEVINYFITQNHSEQDCLEYFNTTIRVFHAYRNKYNIKKSGKQRTLIAKATKFEHYGDFNYNNIEKIQQTCLEKYGTTSPLACKEIHDKTYSTTINRYGGTGFELFSEEKRHEVAKKANSVYNTKLKTDINFKKQILEQQYITKKKNKSFNSSKAELKYYNYLINKYGVTDIIHPYINDPRYPFECDFYIISEDKFVELNRHWTHGGKFYNPNDKTCQEKLLKWQEKANNSKFYANAIETWTVRDVKKLQYAIKNNLNYEVIW